MINGLKAKHSSDVGGYNTALSACSILATDHYHLSWNLGMGLSEGCFIFDFTSLALEVDWPI